MNWKKDKLGEVCEIIAGQSPPSSTYNRSKIGLPFFQGKADFGEVFPTIRFWCSNPNKIALPNDILMSVRAPVGPTNICKTESAIGRGLSAIRSNGKTNYKYVYYYLKLIEPIIANSGNGSTFSAITTGDIKKIEIPVPPIPIQERIADILDEADALRKADADVLVKYNELLKASFSQLFGDPVKNEKKWETKTLESCVSIKGGGTPNTKDSSYYDGNIPWISPKDMKSRFLNNSIDKITEKAINESATNLIEANSVLIVVRSGILKRTLPVAINTIPVAINQDMKALICRPSLSPIFLANQIDFLSEIILQTVRGTTADNISSDVIKKLKLIVPPIPLQNQFAEIAAGIEEQMQIAQLQLEQSESLFHSLLLKAFKGEL